MNIAKNVWSGRSQAVRPPKAFRFDADAVRIRRHGGAVILGPVAVTGTGWRRSPDRSKATSSRPWTSS